MGRHNALFLAVCVWLAGITPVSAATTSATLHNARLSLESYDVELALNTIRELGLLIPVADNDADRREAAFLRSVAAADLYLIAAQRNDADLRASVAQALGCLPENAIASLQQELTAMARGVYASTAKDAAKAMALLAKGASITLADLNGWSGLRRDLFMLSLVRQSLDAGHDPLTTLEALGEDPCADTKVHCRDPFVLFDAAGRKAVAALTEISAIIQRLERTADAGDPLSRALQPDVARHADALAGMTLRPAPSIDPQWQVAEANAAAVTAGPDLVVLVGTSEARYGFVPRVRLTSEYAVEVFAAGSPMLSTPAHVAFPTSFAPSIRPISELTASLQDALGDQQNVAVALGAAPDAPAHLIWRVLLSIRGAGAHPGWLLARSTDGVTQAIAMETINASDEPKPANVYLRVRLGGYTVKIGQQESDIPRVKVDEGWRFDLPALDTALAGRAVRSAEVSFMGDLAAQHLVEAAFRVVPENAALRLVIP